jgi:hypothetical protein
MTHPECSGGGDSRELNEAFWGLIEGVEADVESAFLLEPGDLPKLWEANTPIAVDALSGETFREAMVRAAEGGEVDSGLATQALGQKLREFATPIREGERIAFQGRGVAQVPPTDAPNSKFHQVLITEDMYVIGCLQSVIFDQYWYITAEHTYEAIRGGSELVERSTSWTQRCGMGAVAVLEDARQYMRGGALKQSFLCLRVPLADYGMQVLRCIG